MVATANVGTLRPGGLKRLNAPSPDVTPRCEELSVKFAEAGLHTVVLQETRLQVKGIASTSKYDLYRSPANERGLDGTHVWLDKDAGFLCKLLWHSTGGSCVIRAPLGLLTSLRHCLPRSTVTFNAAHTHSVVLDVIVLMVVILFDSIRGLQRSCSGWSVQHREASWPRSPQWGQNIDPLPFPLS